MKIYRCKGKCCPVGKALPFPASNIETQEGKILNGPIDMLMYDCGQASCHLHDADGEICELVCTKET